LWVSNPNGIAHSGTLRPHKKVLVGFKPQWYSPFWDPKTSKGRSWCGFQTPNPVGSAGFKPLAGVALCQ